MTQEQRERIAEKVAEIAKSNRELLEVVQEMEDENEGNRIMTCTEKILIGVDGVLKQISKRSLA